MRDGCSGFCAQASLVASHIFDTQRKTCLDWLAPFDTRISELLAFSSYFPNPPSLGDSYLGMPWGWNYMLELESAFSVKDIDNQPSMLASILDINNVAQILLYQA